MIVVALIESASSGDRLQALKDLRDVLATSIAECESARDVAALSNQFRTTLAEIEVLSPRASVGDSVDEIARRRAARRSGPAKGADRAKRAAK